VSAVENKIRRVKKRKAYCRAGRKGVMLEYKGSVLCEVSKNKNSFFFSKTGP
jgi:hypothetical protein